MLDVVASRARQRLIRECVAALVDPPKTRVELSNIAGGGLGLFAAERLRRGSICSFYPGLVWREDDLYLDTPVDEHALPVPSFAVSNSYLLRGTDEVGEYVVDGRPFGASAALFRKAAALHGWDDVDCSWLESDLRPVLVERLLKRKGAPTAPIGHLANHADPGSCNMLMEREPLRLSASEQSALADVARSRIPTVAAAQLAKESWVASLVSLVTGGVAHADDGGASRTRWLFPLRTATDVAAGEELTWTYGEDPKSVGWRQPVVR